MATYEQQIEQALTQTLQPDTAIVKQAGTALSALYKNAQCIPALFAILAHHPEPAMRQLAAVELRKRIQGSAFVNKKPVWNKVPKATRDEIKAGLLQIVTSKPGSKIVSSTTFTVAAIASLELPHNQWPELSNWVLTNSRSEDSEIREIGLNVLHRLLENTFDSFKPAMGQVIQLLSESLVWQPSLNVRVAALRAVLEIVDFTEPTETETVSSIQALLPTMFDVVKQGAASGEEELYKHTLTMSESLVLSASGVLSADNFGHLVELMLSIATNREVDDDARVMALNEIQLIVRFKKGRFAALGPDVIGHVVDQVLTIPSEEEESEDPEEDSPAKGAYSVLDYVAKYLPPTHFAPRLFTRFQSLMSSSTPRHRRAALISLSQVVEGCCLYLSDHLDGLWPYIAQGLSDSEANVRKAACMAFGALCEWLGDSVAERHEQFLPLILANLQAQETQRLGLNALDGFLEVLGDAINAYLQGLMERLIVLLDQVEEELKPVVIGAISSAAHAAKEDFTPYFGPVMERIAPLLLKKESEDEIKLRGLCQDAVGTLAAAVGKEVFRPFYDDMMRVAFEAILLDDAGLTECSLTFFGVMARVFKEEFKPALPAVVQALLKSLTQEDGDILGLAGKVALSGDSLEDVLEADGDDDFVDIDGDDDDDDDEYGAPAAVIEKAVAADVLGEIFLHLGTDFTSVLQPSLEALLPLLDHGFSQVRTNASESLLSFVSSMYVAKGGGEYEPSATNVKPLDPDVQKIADAVVPKCLEIFVDEDDADTIRSLLQSFNLVIHEVGPAVIIRSQADGSTDTALFDKLCHFVNQILEGKAPCQQDVDDEDLSPESRSENDAVLVGAAADLVGTLATALGPDFAQAFSTFLPGVASHFYGPNRQLVDRSAAVGSLAEVVNGMQEGISQFSDQLLKLGLDTLNDTSIEIQSNGAWLVSSLVYWSKNDLSSAYGSILQGIRPLFDLNAATGASTTATVDNAKDNACGAVARLVLKNVGAVPLNDVLPVWVGALPLRRDYVEYDKIVLALGKLVEQGAAQQYLDHILQIFAHALKMTAEAKTDEGASLPMSAETQSALVQLLKQVPHEKLAAAGLEGALAQ